VRSVSCTVGIATKITCRRYLDRESKFCEGFANVELLRKLQPA